MLPPVRVSVTRRALPLARIPLSIQSVDRDPISRARPTWGLDEALVTVPGVFVVDRIEVLRGSASALFGNASGGVISIWTRPPAIESVHQEARFVGGRPGERSGRTWKSTTAMRVGDGSAQMTLSRLDYQGERDHSAADQRVLNAGR